VPSGFISDHYRKLQDKVLSGQAVRQPWCYRPLAHTFNKPASRYNPWPALERGDPNDNPDGPGFRHPSASLFQVPSLCQKIKNNHFVFVSANAGTPGFCDEKDYK